MLPAYFILAFKALILYFDYQNEPKLFLLLVGILLLIFYVLSLGTVKGLLELLKNDYDEYGITETICEVEFDKVVVIVDENFFYNNHKLSVRRTEYYDIVKMLYQILSRARKQICLIVVKNEEFFQKALGILENNKERYYLEKLS